MLTDKGFWLGPKAASYSCFGSYGDYGWLPQPQVAHSAIHLVSDLFAAKRVATQSVCLPEPATSVASDQCGQRPVWPATSVASDQSRLVAHQPGVAARHYVI